GASVAAGSSCTFKLDVTATGAALNLLTNTTSTVTSAQGGLGSAATASIFVGDPLQVSYFANLNIGDSVINITNTGARGAGTESGTSAAVTGAICVNVYTLTPDEQLYSCCSCPVTPNGLRSLSLKNDIVTGFGLTPGNPTAVVVKLVATTPVSGSCNL